MIYQITGNLISKHKDFVVLKVGEFGIKVSCTANTISSIKIDEKTLLYTYLHVREDALDLYGFYSIFEREIFLLLICILLTEFIYIFSFPLFFLFSFFLFQYFFPAFTPYVWYNWLILVIFCFMLLSY